MADFKFYEYSPLDYDVLKGWWRAWGWIPEPTPEMLSCNGLIIANNDLPIAAGFVYKTDSVVAWVEHIISNKKASHKDRVQALPLLIDALSKKAKDLGFKVAMISLEHQGLIKMFEKQGYIQTDTNVTNLLKVL